MVKLKGVDLQCDTDICKLLPQLILERNYRRREVVKLLKSFGIKRGIDKV